MDAQIIIQTVANVGFPIAVAIFLLLKIVPAIADLTAATKALTGMVERLCKKEGVE